ncbi:MAG TPA: hypothetical protein VEL76_06850 [Gemmataceae bacterium]|nr:hypothetical protein [Gemmataceae bacterium]
MNLSFRRATVTPRTHSRILLPALLVLLTVSLGPAVGQQGKDKLNLDSLHEPPSFTREPVAVKAGDKVTIENADGKIIRHLAASVLGKNPPECSPPSSFGRVFFPNAGQFRVEVIDTNNNPITTFGKYGNEDSGGPGARVKRPDFPLAWPNYVAVSDRWAYVRERHDQSPCRARATWLRGGSDVWDTVRRAAFNQRCRGTPGCERCPRRHAADVPGRQRSRRAACRASAR